MGFWAGLMAFLATLGYCIVQVLQLYDVFAYPMDERLIYGTSLGIVIPFLVQMLALHHTTPVKDQFWSQMTLTFSTLYAVFVTANYVVQLATVIPMTLRGQLDEIRVLQQTPHSFFWNFDAIGYIFMGLAALAAIPLFKREGFQRWVRFSLLLHALVTPLITIVYFAPDYSYKLLLLGFPWAITAPLFMILLALHFRKMEKKEDHSTATSVHASQRHSIA